MKRFSVIRTISIIRGIVLSFFLAFSLQSQGADEQQSVGAQALALGASWSVKAAEHNWNNNKPKIVKMSVVLGVSIAMSVCMGLNLLVLGDNPADGIIAITGILSISTITNYKFLSSIFLNDNIVLSKMFSSCRQTTCTIHDLVIQSFAFLFSVAFAAGDADSSGVALSDLCPSRQQDEESAEAIITDYSNSTSINVTTVIEPNTKTSNSPNSGCESALHLLGIIINGVPTMLIGRYTILLTIEAISKHVSQIKKMVDGNEYESLSFQKIKNLLDSYHHRTEIELMVRNPNSFESISDQSRVSAEVIKLANQYDTLTWSEKTLVQTIDKANISPSDLPFYYRSKLVDTSVITADIVTRFIVAFIVSTVIEHAFSAGKIIKKAEQKGFNFLTNGTVVFPEGELADPTNGPATELIKKYRVEIAEIQVSASIGRVSYICQGVGVSSAPMNMLIDILSVVTPILAVQRIRQGFTIPAYDQLAVFAVVLGLHSVGGWYYLKNIRNSATNIDHYRYFSTVSGTEGFNDKITNTMGLDGITQTWITIGTLATLFTYVPTTIIVNGVIIYVRWAIQNLRGG